MKAPAILSNSEAIKYFLHALEDKFRDQILENVVADGANLKLSDRRPEDPYTLGEIIKCAEDLGKTYIGGMYSMNEGLTGFTAESSRGTAFPRSSKGPASESIHNDEWGHKISLSSDKHDIELKKLEQKVEGYFREDRTHKQSLAEQLDKLVLLTSQNNNQFGRSNQYSNMSSMSGPRPSNRFNKPTNETCYFCNDLNHRQTECPHLKEFLKREWVVPRNDGTSRIMMKDGGYIPQGDPRESRKEKIERIAKEKGWDKPTQVMFYEEDTSPDAMFYTQPAESHSKPSSSSDPMFQLLAQINNKLDVNASKMEQYEIRLGNFEAKREDDICIFNQSSKNL